MHHCCACTDCCADALAALQEQVSVLEGKHAAAQKQFTSELERVHRENANEVKARRAAMVRGHTQKGHTAATAVNGR